MEWSIVIRPYANGRVSLEDQIKGADAYAIWYDVTDSESFNFYRDPDMTEVKQLMQKPMPKGLLGLIGMKCRDERTERCRVISESEGAQLASDLGCDFFEITKGGGRKDRTRQMAYEAMISTYDETNFGSPKGVPDAATLAEWQRQQAKKSGKGSPSLLQSIVGRP